MAIVPPPTTSGDMLTMLRRHYLPEGRPPGGIFAPEIGSPCGSRRADLIWLSTTIAGKREMVGHEIKVSRADVQVELRDPSKADPWAQYCDRWWLAVSDPALIDGLAIPEPWGIMAPPSGRRTRSMTILRPAPKLNPVASPDGVARVASWLNQRHISLTATQQSEIRWREQTIERLNERMRALEEGTNPRAISPNVQRAMNVIRLAEKGLGERHLWGRFTDEEIAATLVDVEQVRAAARDLARNLEGARSAVQRAAAALKSLPEVDADLSLFGEAI